MLRSKSGGAGLAWFLLGCFALLPLPVLAQSGHELPEAPMPAETTPVASAPMPMTLTANAPAEGAGVEVKRGGLPAPVFTFDRQQAFGAENDFVETTAEQDRIALSELNSDLSVNAPRGGSVSLNGLISEMNRADADTMDDDPGVEKYHWRGLLLQSLAFQSTENLYRMITDTNMRRLLVDKPFWADYMDSMGQWNMRRWWDGDSFLVDYIGHPMEGGVASFIEIQNSPSQKYLRFGDQGYWRSRMLAMLWATAYSTQQKIGPLGEAAIGSDGGISYPLNCPFPCKSFTKYTNNTGWTDFIATPVIGTVWVLVEDFIDREISDRLQGGDLNAVFPKIVRGALNPCRTMANAMRWRKPWYRDYQRGTENLYYTRKVRFLPDETEALERTPRFELFPHFSSIYLPVNTSQCLHCRKQVSGPGLGFSARISKWVDFDTDLTYASNASPVPSDRAGGNMTSATFGFRYGYQGVRWAVKAALRPGFVSYDKAYEASPMTGEPTPNLGRITHFAWATAINADYTVAKHLALRGVIDNTAVRYREAALGPPPPGKVPYLNWLSRQEFLTNENWGYKAGAVLRF
jgi:hypothetical protein